MKKVELVVSFVNNDFLKMKLLVMLIRRNSVSASIGGRISLD